MELRNNSIKQLGVGGASGKVNRSPNGQAVILNRPSQKTYQTSQQSHLINKQEELNIF